MYDDLIANEKTLSSKFLISEQIFDERFDETEYILIKKICENVNLIEKILKTIGSVIEKEKFDPKFKFTILADFLFSMGSFDMRDPANIILKTSRNDYIGKIILRAEMNKIFGYDCFEYIKIHKKLLIGLRKDNILEKSVIRTKKDEWGTIIYFKLKTDVLLEDYNTIGISEYPFAIGFNKKYSIGSFRNIWKLKRKKKEMEDFPICTLSVLKANRIRFRLSEKTYKLNEEVINKETAVILKEVDCNSLDDYFIKIKKIVENSKYSYDLFKEKNRTISLDDIIKVSVKKEVSKLMKYFQKILSIKTLSRNIFNKSFYLPCFIDNRGRQYYGTIISSTFSVLFRYMYEFDEKKNFLNLEKSIFYNKIMKYEDLIKDFRLGKKESYIAIILLIEIGKFYIKTDEKHFVRTEEIINEGIKNYNKESEELEFEDKIYINKIKENLIKLINKQEVDINTIIFKDATASGLQNYGVILGYREDKLKYLNLDGEEWCDTYKYLVDKFIKDSKFSKRKYWKNTIMTIPYNAVWYSCFARFIENLRKDGINYEEMSKEEKNNLKIMHKKFYIDIKKNVKKELFLKENAELIEFKYNEWKIVSKKDYKINFNKARDKYTDIVYMVSEDKDATKRAMEANNMHYLDAALVKKLLEYLELVPIHDCFGVRLCELHILIDKINEYYSKKIGKKVYNIHIIK